MGSPLPPPLTAFNLNLEQHPNNRATVWMNPIVTLEGSFEGDRLTAEGQFVEDVPLPDSLRERLSAADSVDAIAYRFEAGFEEEGFRARYRIRAPDMRAIARDADPTRCSYEYELVGTRFEPPSLSEQPWTQELAPRAPAEGDASGAPAESL